MTRPPTQHRHYDYVVGGNLAIDKTNQDVRLNTVAAGAEIQDIILQMDNDAPFFMTSRAVRCAYVPSGRGGTFDQSPLQGLKTKWTGPGGRDFRQQDYILESLQMAYYGQFGNPKPIAPGILFPAGSVMRIDLRNTGSGGISNLQFFFRGYKLYPWGSVIANTYPAECASQSFAYPVFVSQLGFSELRQNQIFTVKTDADFVLRAGCTFPISSSGEESPRTLAEVFIILKDPDKKPYSNDFIPMDVLWGNSAFPAVVPVGPTPSFTTPFGTGPGQPGLFYPEIYVPKNHQLLYDLWRQDGAVGSNQSEDFTFNLIGAKVFA